MENTLIIHYQKYKNIFFLVNSVMNVKHCHLSWVERQSGNLIEVITVSIFTL